MLQRDALWGDRTVPMAYSISDRSGSVKFGMKSHEISPTAASVGASATGHALPEVR
jgi:hypothetical protein